MQTRTTFGYPKAVDAARLVLYWLKVTAKGEGETS
jgi:hypothetical protein